MLRQEGTREETDSKAKGVAARGWALASRGAFWGRGVARGEKLSGEEKGW